MTKIDKTQPNIIPVHVKNPKLAKDIIEIVKSDKELIKKQKRIANLIKVNEAKIQVLWDRIEDAYEQEIKVISPDGNLTWVIDDDEVYVKKSDEKKKLILDNALRMLK